MKKKILIGFGILIIILGASYMYLNNRNRTMSPPGSAELTSGNLSASITYSRPSARGRLIFGTQEQSALQPYGQYWRLGANEATELTINHDVKFNGEALKAGTYRLYATPGADSFEIIVNSELGKWGAFEPDHNLDILHTTVPVEKITSPVEQYTIRMEPINGGIQVIFEWSDTRFAVPLTTP